MNRDFLGNYEVLAWNQYETQVLSSGPPFESDLDIIAEKEDEINAYIDIRFSSFNASFGIGPIRISMTFYENHFEFHTVQYSY